MNARTQLLLVLLAIWASRPIFVGSLPLALEASGLHPVVLLPGGFCSQLDARLTGEFDPASTAPSCGGGVLKGKKKGWFRLWNNRTALQEDPALVPCYAELLRLVYDPAAGDYRNVRGVETRVVAFGTTRGFGYGEPAMKNLCMEKLVQALEAVGYREGETLFGAPHDFRYAPAPPGQANREFDRFLSSLTALVEQASERNGDMPVILVTHSLGGLHANVFLRRSSLAWRRRYVKHFVMVSAGAGGGRRTSAAIRRVLTAGRSALVPRHHQELRRRVLRPAIAQGVRTRAAGGNASQELLRLRHPGVSDDEVARYVARVLPVTMGVGAPSVPMTCVNGVGVPTAETLVYWDGDFSGEPDEVLYGDGDGATNILSLLALDTLIGATGFSTTVCCPTLYPAASITSGFVQINNYSFTCQTHAR